MKLNVVNKELNVGAVKIIEISGSSVFLIGDTQVVNCSSVYDAPPDSLIMSSPVSEQEQEQPLSPHEQVTS